jgi:hypothetical protein
MALPSALAALCAIPNWVIWRAELRDDEWTKPPYMAKSPRRHASTADKSTWSSYELAAEAAEREGLRGPNGGTGFVLQDSGIGGIDLDDCVDLDTGEISDWALEIVAHARRCGCYVEFSPNLSGLHILGRSSGAAVHTRWSVGEDGVVELFRSTHRYLTITGKQFGGGDVGGNIDPVIDELIGERPAERSSSKANSKASNGKANGKDDTPSGLFNKVVCKMWEQGLNADEIVAHLRKHARRYDHTSLERYEKAGRLLAMVEAVVTGWKERHGGSQTEVAWSTGRLPRAKSLADALIAVAELGIQCSNDEFHVRHFVAGSVLGRWEGELTDAGVAFIRGLILKTYAFDTGRDVLNDALFQLCIENSFDPVLDYLNALVWDGKPRLDDWVVRYLGCEESEWHCTIGRLFLIAAVRRVRAPGTKFDQSLVLEGEEGTGKSTAIEVLAGEANFSDQFMLDTRHAREQQELFQGVWLGEFADLKGMQAADANAIKAFLSRTVDRARPAYGRRVVDQKRRTILVGTTNELGGYLKGSYGNRRWWAIKTGRILLKSLTRDRDQLWAEAAVREAEGASIVLPQRLWEVAKGEQEARQEQDPWDLRLAEVKGRRYPRRDGLDGWEERVHSRDLYRVYLNLKASDEKGGGTARRVSEAMRRLQWDPEQIRIGGVSAAGWVKRHDD